MVKSRGCCRLIWPSRWRLLQLTWALGGMARLPALPGLGWARTARASACCRTGTPGPEGLRPARLQ